MKTFSIAFVILLLIGMFSPSDSLFNFLKYEGNTLFETQSAAVYLPFRACPSEYKGDNNQCTTYNFEQDLNIYKDLNIAVILKDSDPGYSHWQKNPGGEISVGEAWVGWGSLYLECSEACKSRLDYMTFEINKEPFEFMKYTPYYRLPSPEKKDFTTRDAYDKQYQIWVDNYWNYPEGEFNDQILFAKSIWDPANNPDHLAAEIAIRNDIPFWDSWANVEENIIYIAKEYKLTFLLIMTYAGLAFAGAIFIFQFAVTVISGMGAKKDGRYKTGFKDNVTTADAVQSVQGPLSALNPIKYAFFIIGTLCYLPFMIYIPLFFPGGFAPHLVEVIFFYFVLFFMGGLALVTLLPIYIIVAIYSLAIGEPMPF